MDCGNHFLITCYYVTKISLDLEKQTVMRQRLRCDNVCTLEIADYL